MIDSLWPLSFKGSVPEAGNACLCGMENIHGRHGFLGVYAHAVFRPQVSPMLTVRHIETMLYAYSIQI
jgi:hypothetical protein